MTAENAEFKMTYLDLQAYTGVTKHMGGFEATNELPYTVMARSKLDSLTMR